MVDRRKFIKAGAITSLGLSMRQSILRDERLLNSPHGKRVGIIGLDTSHSIAFTEEFNSLDAGNNLMGYKVTAAYPFGSPDIKSAAERIEKYTQQIKNMGVEITGSIKELIEKSDVILLETNDGRKHLEQTLPVLKAGKRIFIDKPMTASLSDAMIIFNAAKKYGIPLFSSSSLRYIQGMDEIKNGAVGNILGAETYSPAPLEKTHPDLFWYGIHGVETLFTAMGTGCKTVSRTFTPGADVVVGIWENERIGTFRGIRKGKSGYGGVIYGEKGIQPLGRYNGYYPLLKEVALYFDQGTIPVQPEETLEIMAFMEAADISKASGGKPVSIQKVMDKARKKSSKYSF